MSKLGQRLFLEKSTMTGVIDKMEADGLVQRRSDLSDRRALRIYLTPKAKRLNERIFKIIDKAYSELSGDLTAQDLATSVKVSKRIGQAAHDLSANNDKKG
jgi:DNA-binding MarR family transcriptional regulator